MNQGGQKDKQESRNQEWSGGPKNGRRPILIFDAVAVTACSRFVCLYSFPSAGPKCHPWQGGSYIVGRQRQGRMRRMAGWGGEGQEGWNQFNGQVILWADQCSWAMGQVWAHKISSYLCKQLFLEDGCCKTPFTLYLVVHHGSQSKQCLKHCVAFVNDIPVDVLDKDVVMGMNCSTYTMNGLSSWV